MNNKARDAALLATTKLLDKIPSPREIITNEQLMEWAGIEPPEGDHDKKTHDDFSLFWLRVRDHFITFVIERTGRMLATEHSVGFRLLAPGESTPYIEDVAVTKVKRTLNRALGRIASVRSGDLTVEENERRTRTQVRLGMLSKAADQCRDDGNRPSPDYEATVGHRGM